jgi:putative ABC transport system substrate-binding protein
MKNNYFIVFILFLTMLFSILFLNSGDNTPKIKKVAFVSLSEVDNNTFFGFKGEMVSLGWEEGKNISYLVTKPAGKIENLKGIVEHIISQKPDLIFVSSTPAAQEVKKAIEKSPVPAVFCPVNDPLSSNIVKNLLKPEGMMTGVSLAHNDDKRLEWLKKIAPGTETVLIPYTPDDDSSLASRNDVKTIHDLLNIKIIEKPFDPDLSVEEFFSSVKGRFEAVYIPRDSNVEKKIREFSEYTIRNKIPLSVPSYQQVKQGALFAYGFVHYNLGKEAAGHANKILRGVQVRDLPVKVGESHLVLNETTAKKIGIEFSPEVLRNAKIILK